jgi:hypothetical protein
MTTIRYRPMTALRLLAAALVAATVAPTCAIGQTTYTGPEGHYSVKIPEGFERVPEELLDPLFDAAYQAQSPLDPSLPINIEIQRLETELPQQLFDEDDVESFYAKMPGATSIEHSTLEWRGHTVNVLETTLSTPYGPWLKVIVQLPIKDHALQLLVGAPVDQSATAHELLAQIASTVAGDIRWFETPSGAAQPQGPREVAARSATRGLFVGIAAGGFAAILLNRRRLHRGAMLAIALVLLVVGQAMARLFDTTAVVGIGQALSLLGGCVALLGIAGLFRAQARSHPQDPSTAPDRH